ncbi:MAG TPA: hydroxysqualene dehydroxylase HpnE [Solirubrobacteraceae bacterium]|nr:hydroxysqualene dehydroxylase HpnE [Solirubrobacteraceae bacterium]
MSGARRVAVIGGGLAGITAALDCADAGAEVTLLEVRRRLGGAVYSFERDGMQIDNGQHVFMRCCPAYRQLLARLGSERSVYVQPRLRVPVLSPGRPPSALARGALPAPLHMAGSFVRYRHLTPLQRLRAARAALALSRLDVADAALDELSFGEWLERHGQDRDAVDAFWDVIVRPTLNAPASESSLALGAFVFHTALLSSADAGDIGFHAAPLSEVVGEPARRALADAGVEVRLGWRAQTLEHEPGGYLVGGGGEEMGAQAAIVAVPHARAAALLRELLPELASSVGSLGSSPIVNVHVVFDRQVCEEPFAAGVRTPVQYIVDRTAAGGVPDGHQYLAISLSGAAREMQMSVPELREAFVPALRELLPRARDARVERFFVTREHAATFLAAPGTAALRPGPRTPLSGLALAGAYTDTGWPATLEGAVRSGHAAARAALAALELDVPAPAAYELAVGERAS